MKRKFLTKKVSNQIEYIAQQTNNKLFDILDEIDKRLKDEADNSLKIIRNKIVFVIKTRFN